VKDVIEMRLESFSYSIWDALCVENELFKNGFRKSRKKDGNKLPT
jgi:hypothetical protein